MLLQPVGKLPPHLHQLLLTAPPANQCPHKLLRPPQQPWDPYRNPHEQQLTMLPHRPAARKHQALQTVSMPCFSSCIDHSPAA